VEDGTTGIDAAPQADHIHFLFEPRRVVGAVASQRRRFATTVESLDSSELAEVSRCPGWTVADVLRHGLWVDATLRAIWSGQRSLRNFDPRTTPNETVEANRQISDHEIQEQYLVSSSNMVRELESAGLERFGQPSISPAGKVPWWLSVVHAGWDAAIHERDVLVPLGRPVVAVEEETTPFLAYGLVLASLIAGNKSLSVRVDDVRLRCGDGPVTAWSVEPMDDPTDATVTVLSGSPEVVIDAIAGRGALHEALAGPVATIDQLSGLADFFSSPGA